MTVRQSTPLPPLGAVKRASEEISEETESEKMNRPTLYMFQLRIKKRPHEKRMSE